MLSSFLGWLHDVFVKQIDFWVISLKTIAEEYKKRGYFYPHN